MLGDPGQLDAAGEVILCEAGKGLPSVWPKQKQVIHLRNWKYFLWIQMHFFC